MTYPRKSLIEQLEMWRTITPFLRTDATEKLISDVPDLPKEAENFFLIPKPHLVAEHTTLRSPIYLKYFQKALYDRCRGREYWAFSIHNHHTVHFYAHAFQYLADRVRKSRESSVTDKPSTFAHIDQYFIRFEQKQHVDRKYRKSLISAIPQGYIRYKTRNALQQLWQEQPGDFFVVPAQLGSRYLGLTYRDVRHNFQTNEFCLGPYEIMAILLTHPERLRLWEDPSIHAAGLDCGRNPPRYSNKRQFVYSCYIQRRGKRLGLFGNVIHQNPNDTYQNFGLATGFTL